MTGSISGRAWPPSRGHTDPTRSDRGGGGQSGFAIGRFLARQGRDLVTLEAADGPAAAWRARWQALKLFTPVR